MAQDRPINDAELLAALRPHSRPRIVQVVGRIDLSSDETGRPLGAEHFRDPGFNWVAYEQAYDPATWGKVGRNEACPCGSGKKYKHCHGQFA